MAAADAGVSVFLDAGVSSKADCEVTITRWERIPVYAPAIRDGGLDVQTSAPVQYIYLPDVRLTGHTESVATQQVDATATASAAAVVDVPRAAAEMPRGSLQALGTLDTKGTWGGEVGMGVRVVDKWWLVTGIQWTPGDAVRGGLGVRKDF